MSLENSLKRILVRAIVLSPAVCLFGGLAYQMPAREFLYVTGMLMGGISASAIYAWAVITLATESAKK